ncbi:MAG: FAD/NAD(P)-binding protein, partial [Pedobacter sp.]|nr:FAD/NAD(P)-binding protein [Pedobacter sp.]
MLKNIALIGGGSSALFMFQRFVQARNTEIIVDIFEKSHRLGAGMPYSNEGALEEHITNVSGNEIPELVSDVSEWIKTIPKEVLDHFAINLESFSPYHVLPRLLFGNYLEAQFTLLIRKAGEIGMSVNVFLDSEVTDVMDLPKENKIQIAVKGKFSGYYDHVIICTGHTWPKTFEGKIDQYYDSPYPPEKLKCRFNHPIAIKGSSLTAIDAIRTLARQHGKFSPSKHSIPIYQIDKDCGDFKMVMHSRHGMLPAVRFHLADSHLLKEKVLSRAEVAKNMQENDGFLLLDFVFDKNFKELFKEK